MGRRDSRRSASRGNGRLPRNLGRPFPSFSKKFGTLATSTERLKMPPRAPSPALSENEFDITNALFADGGFGSDEDLDTLKPKSKDFGQELGVDDDLEDGSEDEAFIAAQQQASNRKNTNLHGKTVKKGGGFQAMGLSSALLKAITFKGFSVPTPIQRKTIPLILDGQDVVGMARTGSGKTAAFVIPMIEKLKGHSARVGARAIILSPSRELAIQTVKVVKELGKGTDLRTVLLVGGENLNDDFAGMAANPDIIIATPGRFLNIKAEMKLDLGSVKYIVFDEADRLFEQGFAEQLTELLYGLPASRQTLLFSATLPKSLVEFARAGLQDPKLVRLDTESKVSPDLSNAFFSVKSAEKEGALLHILEDVIKIPTGPTEATLKAKEKASSNGKKRKRGQDGPSSKTDSPTPHSTIVFVSTKHHVEYIAALLKMTGYAVSQVYGSLDQTARKIQVHEFRTGLTNILVVTDVAARGIDIPILANVINYDFPFQPKIFVHRVGRTARAGKKGWSYSLVATKDVPYLLDLQLFLSKRLILGRETGDTPASFTEDIAVGSLIRDKVERGCEWVTKVIDESADLTALRDVAAKGEKLYIRTRKSASSESAKRSKDVIGGTAISELHLLFSDDINNSEVEREKMLARISGFRPQETIFEIGKRGAASEAAEIMRKRREKIDPKRRAKAAELEALPTSSGNKTTNVDESDDDDFDVSVADPGMETASEDELEVTFSQPSSKGKSGSFQDAEHFMSYLPTSTNLAEDRAYGVHSGGTNASNFLTAARGVEMDLVNDESKSFAQPSRMRWDKRHKKYVSRVNDEDGSKGKKLVRGESGIKIAASYHTGRFDQWRKENKISHLPRVGESESTTTANMVRQLGPGGKRFRHRSEKAPKAADKFRDDYHVRKKRVSEAKEKFQAKDGKNELKSLDKMAKARRDKQNRRDKNARPTRKGRG